MFSDAGHLIAAPETTLVASTGPCEMSTFEAKRDVGAIGRMDGSWPLLEVLSTSERGWHHGTMSPGAPEVLARVMAFGAAGAVEQPVLRVGSHDKLTLARVAHTVFGAPYDCEPGPAGWSWLRGAAPGRVAANAPTLEAALVDCVLALWQPGGAEQLYRLPIEMEALSFFTFGLLHFAGIPFKVEFRPRYLPLHVDVSLVRRRDSHAVVQAVVSAQVKELVELRLEGRGCYAVVNGLLCAQ